MFHPLPSSYPDTSVNQEQDLRKSIMSWASDPATSRRVLPVFDDDASTVVSTWTPAYVTRLAPINSPMLWEFINAILFAWSFLLTLEISNAVIGESLNHSLEESHWYLIWNFGSTIIWCLEVTLTALVRADEGENWQDSYLILCELVLAIYFTCDSIRLYRKWREESGDLEGELFDAILNTIGYFYLLLKAGAFNRFVWRKRNENYELIV